MRPHFRVRSSYLLGALLTAAPGCWEPQKGDTAVYPDTGVPGTCTFNRNYAPHTPPGLPYSDAVLAHCVHYRGPNRGDDLRHIVAGVGNPPACVVTGAPTNTDLSWDPDADYFSEFVKVPNICGKGEGWADYALELNPTTMQTCASYEEEEHNWVLIDQLTSEPYIPFQQRPGCPYLWEEHPPPPAQELTRSAAVPCNPGSAEFDLVGRYVSGHDASGNITARLMPIARTDARFPERAWLRRIEILDWGSVSSLRVAGHGTALELDANGAFSNGHLLQTPTSDFSFAVGDVTMSAMFGVSGIAPGTTPALPAVRLHWTCQREVGNPHWKKIKDHDGYLADLSSYGIQHRFLFWMDEEHPMLRVAPAGRYLDRVHLPYDEMGNVYGRIPLLGATIEGRLVQTEEQLQIIGGTISIGDLDPIEIEITAEVLPPLNSND